MTGPREISLADLLFSQGFGTRRDCAELIRRGRVSLAGQTVSDPERLVATAELSFEVDGEPWRYRRVALLYLNKPLGYECSRRPGGHPSALSLLPEPLQRRVQPVGRLDVDTAGLLLTDDGQMAHRLTHPRHRILKTYLVTCRHPVSAGDRERLLAGVSLRQDGLCRAERCEPLDERRLELAIASGKYHQARRMIAAIGNRVEALVRVAIGGLRLPPDLPPGGWDWLDERAARDAFPGLLPAGQEAW